MNKLENIIKKSFLTVATAATMAIGAYSQNYNANFKVRELTHGTGTNISNVDISLIDTVNNYQYMAKTDANGVANIQQVRAGNYKLTVSKDEYIELVKKNYTVDGNEQVNASLKRKQSTGPWGSYEFDVAFFKASTPEIFGNGGRNPPQSDHILPIYTRIDGATPSDLAKINVRKDSINTKTGYELFRIVDNSVSADTTHTVYVNSTTNTSSIATNENYEIIYSWSKITSTDPTKKFDHEAWFRLGKRPGQYGKVTISDDLLSTMPNYPQTCDYGDVAAIFDQAYAVKSGEQNLFNMSELFEFTPETTPVSTATIAPANGATGISPNADFKWTPVNADEYRLQISRNASFTDLVIDEYVGRNNINLSLSASTIFYERIMTINDVGNSSWSPTTHFTTANTPTVNITSPTSGATVATEFATSWTGGNAPYEIKILDADNNVVKDSTNIMGNNASFNVIKGHRAYTLQIKALNTEYTSVNVNTENNAPTAGVYTSPTNNSKLNASNYIDGKLKIITNLQGLDQDLDVPTNNIKITGPGVNYETTVSKNGLETILVDSAIFQPNTQYTAEISTSDGYTTVNGTSIKFTTPSTSTNHAPTTYEYTNPQNGLVEYVNGQVEIESTTPTDADNDQLIKYTYVKGPGLDTTIATNNMSENIYLDSILFKKNSTYTISGEVTDGKDTTKATNVVTVKTPNYTSTTTNTIDDKFKVYPTITEGILNIEVSGIREEYINIYSIDGKLQEQIRTEKGETQTEKDISNYSPGVYLIQEVTNGTTQTPYKVIKQ